MTFCAAVPRDPRAGGTFSRSARQDSGSPGARPLGPHATRSPITRNGAPGTLGLLCHEAERRSEAPTPLTKTSAESENTKRTPIRRLCELVTPRRSRSFSMFGNKEQHVSGEVRGGARSGHVASVAQVWVPCSDCSRHPQSVNVPRARRCCAFLSGLHGAGFARGRPQYEALVSRTPWVAQWPGPGAPSAGTHLWTWHISWPV